ncbi:TrkH family potassium uptake protein [Thermopetrobacter sp. TC1]|uniref:TrkH family potassium uptake protein n=1 Tax=Thermopetrobacter sp. TC1 TaxID=1495045 RepID=UPI0012E09A55|nr:TrkH family potassium uptake protein [Thermopetrobacter sp. TC1]
MNTPLARTSRDRRRSALPVDPYRILFVIGALLLLLSLFMIPPMLVDVLAQNPDWHVFAVSALITGFAGLMLALISRDAFSDRVLVREGFLLTVTSWLAVSLAAALPYLLYNEGKGFADAWFEAVSGLTTTGSTVFTGLDSMPPGILLWRSLTQWIGGIGIVVMALIMLPFLRIGGMQLFQTESSDRSDKLLPRAQQFIAGLTAAYLVLTITCALAYKMAGMRLFDALNHALTTISTGGFSTHDASMGFFTQPAIHWVATFYMLASSVPLVLYLRFFQERRLSVFADAQVLGFFRIVVFFILLLVGWRVLIRQDPLLVALRETAFNVSAIISTTGYALGDFTQWGTLSVMAFFAIMFLGGCTGSTAGGMKIFRLQIMRMAMAAHLKRLVSPHRVVTINYQGRSVTQEIVASVFAFVSAMFATVLVFAVLVSATGVEFVTALSAAVTAVTNVGPGLGDIIGPSGNFATLPDLSKIFLAIAMLLGRLEFFTLLVVLTPAFWK